MSESRPSRVVLRTEPLVRTAPPRPALAPIDTAPSFKHQAYAALKNAIVAMDIYRSRDDIRLDERKLAQDFGISRTPVREALAQLEREGFVRSVPRRGLYIVRKTRQEVIEMITAWAALESMAARLITQEATDDEIAALRRMFTTFASGEVHAKLDEYSEVNIEFHQAIIRLSRSGVLMDLAENLFTHSREQRLESVDGGLFSPDHEQQGSSFSSNFRSSDRSVNVLRTFDSDSFCKVAGGGRGDGARVHHNHSRG